MRLCMTGLAAVALGTVFSGCAGPTGLVVYGVAPNGAYAYEFPRVDREQAAERTVEGAGPFPVILERTPYDKTAASRSEISAADHRPRSREAVARYCRD